MAIVILHAPVEGLQVGDEYDGPNAEYHVIEGNARYKSKSKKGYDPYAEPKAVEYVHEDVEENSDPTPTAPATLPPIAEETIENGTLEDHERTVAPPVGDATPTEQTDADKIKDIADPNVDPHA